MSRITKKGSMSLIRWGDTPNGSRVKNGTRARSGKRGSRPSKLELELRGQLLMAGLTQGTEVEYMAIPGRKFRWDIAWPSEKLLVEIQGGVWSKSGHTSGVGVNRDTEKANLAVLAGWRVLAVTTNQIREGKALRWIQQALGKSDTI